MRRGTQRCAAAVILTLIGVSLASAQAPQTPRGELRMSEGPFYADVPITLQLRIEGFDSDPAPTITHTPISDSATLHLSAISPSRQSFMTSRNGKVTSWERTTWTANYEFTISQPGTIESPTFTVTQGSKEITLRGRRFVAAAVPTSDKIGIEIVLPERPLFPGQRTPVEIRMKLDVSLENSVRSYTIRSPLFELQGDFNFIDEPVQRGSQALEVIAGGEKLQLKRTVERKRVNGRDELWLVARRTLVPLRPGEFDIAPSSLVLEQITRWKRGRFGDRVPGATELFLAKDLPRRLVVKDLPLTGRPPSFAGAVGKGFSLEVEADRTVVSTGDPIELTFTLTGDGNIQAAGLPSLTDAGLSGASFGIAQGKSAGIYSEGKKVFRVSIRANDAEATEIPPLEYSWYDPAAEAYRTTATDPIALSVKQGETVGAASVVGVPTPSLEDPEGIPPSNGGTGRPRFVLDGADLSVEKRPERLAVAERHRFGGRPMRAGIYALGFFLIFLSIGSRLRDRVTPEVRERRQRLAGGVRTIEKAAGDLSPESLRTVVGTLRTMAREVRQGGGEVVEDLEAFLTDCEDRIYAPSAEGAAPREVAERAKRLAQALLEAGR